METDFGNFFLPFNIKTNPGDIVIASPVYAFEALMSENRKLSPAKFFRRIILVDAVNGSSEITKLTKFPAPVVLDENIEFYRLEPCITSATARFVAEKGTLTYEERSFGVLHMDWKIYSEHFVEKRLYKGYIIREDSLIDSFSAHAAVSPKIYDLPSKLRKNS